MPCKWKNGFPVNRCRAKNILYWCQKYKLTEDFISNPPHFCAILTKCVVPLEIFRKSLSIEFHANPSSGSRADIFAKTDRHIETRKVFSISKRACLKWSKEKGYRKAGDNNGPLKLTLIDNNWWQQLATEQSVVMATGNNTFIFLNIFMKRLQVFVGKISFCASPGNDRACTYCIPSAGTNQSV